MVQTANPIYDSVFKYLLEDERITKALLSSLLKKEVLEVNVRRNEYSNQSKAGVSIFRIDFGAKVRNADGSEQVILIELQKAWIDTEILRFRQYLGVQYANSENMAVDKDGEKRYGLPIVAIYILGHGIEGIDIPVVYVRRSYLDYDNNPITKGVPNNFIESLTHDSIIVQIPYLQDQENNPLERILKIFNQQHKSESSQQLLNIDENNYGANEIERLIIDRLVRAAADPEVRQSMNIEDEVMLAFEIKDRKLAKTSNELAEKERELAESQKQIAQRDEQIVLLVKMLLKGGQTVEEIAIALGRSVDEIRILCQN